MKDDSRISPTLAKVFHRSQTTGRQHRGCLIPQAVNRV